MLAEQFLKTGKDYYLRGVAYKEYDVNPKVKGQNRGAERIIIGADGTRYYTGDHYKTFTKF
ncbi:ribonuclease domain-containing protein [Pedobacter sp. WC2423]|uniref:ribonuclease domain-containing protein n=1 Tax=Pedobacter sp. WC2423 TaxID=3234142 RepID=UPI0034664B81